MIFRYIVFSVTGCPMSSMDRYAATRLSILMRLRFEAGHDLDGSPIWLRYLECGPWGMIPIGQSVRYYDDRRPA
jgi:hypothetical protein